MTFTVLKDRTVAIPAPVLGILLIVIASAFFALMHNTIRFLSVTEDIHPFEMAFFRVAFGLIVFIPFFMRSGIGILRTHKFSWHFGRAFLNAASMLSWFTALSLMPVGDATAVSLIGPVFVAILAMIFLGEHVGCMRWFGIVLAVIGGLVVVRPGFTEISSGVWLVLFSAFAVSFSKLIAKILTGHDSPTTIVAYMTLLMTPIMFVPAFFVWQTPTPYQLFFMALIGIFGTVGHLLFVQAYKLADMSLVEPVMFTRMVWAALISLVLFAEFPTPWTWAGAGVIVIGTTLLARKEARHESRRVEPNASTVDPGNAD
ncbi:MAG: RNA polymerase subunit sigma-54 [Rhodospirillaceae bacterium]|nr:RNA polymerase subunit sigma-54 [Rhodospirillaceae bacterium]|tara:strand:- start:174 stop:1118 length:945 start_codon:yes stop_codon:yes gene_type:complete